MKTARTDYHDADVRWTCTRKKAYHDEDIARRVASRVSHTADDKIVHYGCTHCGLFHIGRPTDG